MESENTTMNEKTLTITKEELDKIIQEHIVVYNEKLFEHLKLLREEIERIGFDATFCLSLLLSEPELERMYQNMKKDYEKALKEQDEQIKESEENAIV